MALKYQKSTFFPRFRDHFYLFEKLKIKPALVAQGGGVWQMEIKSIDNRGAADGSRPDSIPSAREPNAVLVSQRNLTRFKIVHPQTKPLKTKLRGLNPRANYTGPSDRRLSLKWVQTLTNRGSHVVSAADPYGRILDFLHRCHYFFFQLAPQL
jgi:hypothetical protein